MSESGSEVRLVSEFEIIKIRLVSEFEISNIELPESEG